MATIKQTVAFDPRSLSGCQMWLDAADTSSMTLSGSNILEWRDKSGNRRHFTATSGNFTSTLDGTRRIVNVTGTTYMTSVTSLSLTANVSWFFVVAKIGRTTDPPMYLINLTPDGDESVRYHFNTGSYGGAPGAPGDGNDLLQPGQSFINGVLNTATTYTNYHQINGPIQNSRTTTSITLSSPFMERYFLGSIAELLFFSGPITTSQRQQVEGYLAWKWDLIANLPSGHPFKRAPIAPFSFSLIPTRPKNTALPTFDPRTIPGCQLWLDATDPNGNNTIPANGSSVITWVDKSGNGYNTSNLTGTPTYSSNGINFTGNQAMGTNLGYATTLSNSTMFAVTSYTSVFQGAFIETNNTLGNNGCGIDFFVTGGQQRVNGWATGLIVNGATGLTVNTRNLHAFSFSTGTPAAAYLYLDGSQSGSNTSLNFTYTAGGLFSLGNWKNGGSYGDFFRGIINEILVFSKILTTTERQQVEGYLAWKWGLQRNLPSSHLHSTIAPNAFQLTAPFKARIINPLSNLATVIFNYTGSNQSFTVPAGKTLLYVYLWGAGGGSGGTDTSVTGGGGAGAMVQGILTVIPGENLTIIVGSGGVGSGATNVYGGGGRGTNQFEGTAGSGGGRSAIRRSTNDLVTAGGGGGGSWQGTQGGSATFSGTANNGSGGSAGGKGGSQIAGGVAGSGGVFGGAATAGSQYQGGNSSGFGGGGGGGYFGGGGASSDIGAGGGGGSSFINNLTLIPGQSVLGFTSVDSISAPNTSSPYYSGTVGRGGNKTGIASTSGVAGGNGLVVIRY